MSFIRATKRAARLRIGMSGPSGSGKTYSALEIATHLVGPSGRIALVDTEHGSASKYADRFTFDVSEMGPPFHPDRFIKAIMDAEAAAYDALILDSLSHAWAGPGGLLEVVDAIAKRMRTPNTWAAWKEATPIQNRLVEAILAARLHIVATMRSKSEWVQEEVERGGRKVTAPKRVGTAPVQRDQFEYEFDVFAELTLENEMIVSKTRCPDLHKAVIAQPGAQVAATLKAWLEAGAPPLETEPAPAPGATASPEEQVGAAPAPSKRAPSKGKQRPRRGSDGAGAAAVGGADKKAADPQQPTPPAAAPATTKTEAQLKRAGAARVDLDALRATLAEIPDDIPDDQVALTLAQVVEHWPEAQRDTVVRTASASADGRTCAIAAYEAIPRVAPDDCLRALRKIIERASAADRGAR